MFWSIKKSRALRKISTKLAGKPDMGLSFIEAMNEGGFDAIDKLLKQQDIHRKELYEIVHKDPNTQKVLQGYNISDKELDDLYSSLIREGAGVYRKGHWVAASTLVFSFTLEYAIIQKRNGDDCFSRACKRLIEYFDRNETGPLHN